jgi:hypothetical protein
VVQTLPGRQELQALAESLAPQFAAAEPFPHVVVDGLLADGTMRAMIDSFPPPSPGWEHFDDPYQLKFALRDEEAMPPAIRSVIQHFNSQVFIEFLETLTGIRGLIPDPHLAGGGLHQIPRGGTLKVHADFNKHRRLRADRRLNVLLYLNEDWQEEYGGYLELWDPDMTRAVVRLAPVANRMVVFETTSTTYHGHPDKLAVPEGMYRRSLAWYYYTTPTVTDGVAHTTLWAPGQNSGLAGVRKRIRRLVPTRPTSTTPSGPARPG